jgi:hypothetical protein
MSKVSRQLPLTEMLHVPARSPLSWCARQPGGPVMPPMSAAAISTARCYAAAAQAKTTTAGNSAVIFLWRVSRLRCGLGKCVLVVFGNFEKFLLQLLRRNLVFADGCKERFQRIVRPRPRFPGLAPAD